MRRLIAAGAFLLSFLAQQALAQVTVSVPNNASGTTIGSIAKGTVVSSAVQALTAATGDTQGFLGIVLSGAGTSGNALIVVAGIAPCTFDGGAVTANHWVINSAATAGLCKDGGAVTASPSSAGQIIGISQATGSGSQNVLVVPVSGIASVTGASTSGANTWTGSNTFSGAQLLASTNVQAGTTYTLAATDCGHAISFTSASAITLTTLNSLPIGCAIAVIQSGAGQVTVANGAGSTFNSVNSYSRTKAQYAVIGLTVDSNAGGTAAHYIFSGDGV